MKEAKIERYLVKRVKALGGEIRKVEFINHRGAPDRRVMTPHLPPFWVELKAPGIKPEPHQVREHKRMRRLGEVIEVVDSIEQVDEVLK